jgi:hypothetical protein
MDARTTTECRSENRRRIAILGSCVTREIFEFPGVGVDSCSIVHYGARQSICSAMSPPPQTDLQIGTSTFEERRSNWDATKSHWNLLELARPEWIIVDFIDERLGLLKYQDAYLTASVPIVRRMAVISPSTPVLRPWSPEVMALRRRCLVPFLAKALEICPNVLIHRVSWAERYLDQDGQLQHISSTKFARQVELHNSVLADLYRAIEDCEVPVRWLNHGPIYAGGKHRFEFSPIHYDCHYFETIHETFRRCLSTPGNGARSIPSRPQAAELLDER